MAVSAAVCFAIVAQGQATTVALTPDNLFHHPPALGILHHKRDLVGPYIVTMTGRMLPTMLMPYLGAFKSYLLAPFLLIFGTSPTALVQIHAFFALVFILSAAAVCKVLSGPAAAITCFLFILLDPNFLGYVPNDQGPAVAAMVLQVL